MHTGRADNPLKEEILKQIFHTFQEVESYYVHSVLMAIFLPGLESIFHRTKWWNRNSDERGSDITWAFFQSASQIYKLKEPKELAQKIINKTWRELRREYRRKGGEWKCDSPTDPAIIVTKAREMGFTWKAAKWLGMDAISNKHTCSKCIGKCHGELGWVAPNSDKYNRAIATFKQFIPESVGKMNYRDKTL